MTTFLIFI